MEDCEERIQKTINQIVSLLEGNQYLISEHGKIIKKLIQAEELLTTKVSNLNYQNEVLREDIKLLKDEKG